MFRVLEWILVQHIFSTVYGGYKMLRAQKKSRHAVKAAALVGSGWGGIRTPVRLSPKAVFKTAALDHSATHPKQKSLLPARATLTTLYRRCQTDIADWLRVRQARPYSSPW
jgi:hypothetical protein